MARIVWVAVGAAAGVWAYKRGEQALARARERSALENLQAAQQTATKVAATSAKVVAAAGAQGARVAARLTPSSAPEPGIEPGVEPVMAAAAAPPDATNAGP